MAKLAVVSGVALLAVQVIAIAPALANAANPNPDTKAVAKVNSNGTVTVNLTGTWSWPGQNCEGRYGEGWAVDWWGISSSSLPANNFSLTNASYVSSAGVPGTGATFDSTGSIQIQNTGTYFHVGPYYDGEDINSSTTCTDTTINGQQGSTGSWSATATYPSKADLPPNICVIMYDEHGSEGQNPGGNNFSPTGDNDNSIQTNNFNPTVGMGYCAVPKVVPPPKPGIGLLKQVCKVATAKCSASDNADWTSKHEIPSGSTAVWRITVTDTGDTTLKNVTITDGKAPGCAQTLSGTLKPKGTAVVTCDTGDVTKGFTNVATVTGAPPSGASVTATGSAKVSVIPPPPGITTSQSLTPNDEGFVTNGEGATGKMTFSLFPPSDPTCSGTPAFTQTVTVTNGVANTSNTTFIATAPGTWRWLVTYTGDATHKKATSGCGVEYFTLVN